MPRQKEYVAGHDRLYTAYGFFLLNADRATPDLFAETITSWGEADGWPSWSLGNHDVPRFASRLAGDDPARTKLLTALLLCLRGTIFLYQGEELGLAPRSRSCPMRLREPRLAIAAYTGDAGRDGARTPMPWTGEGAQRRPSTAKETWLPVDERYLALAADIQEADETSMLNFTRRIIAERATARRSRQPGSAGAGGRGGYLRIQLALRSSKKMSMKLAMDVYRLPSAAQEGTRQKRLRGQKPPLGAHADAVDR